MKKFLAIFGVCLLALSIPVFSTDVGSAIGSRAALIASMYGVLSTTAYSTGLYRTGFTIDQRLTTKRITLRNRSSGSTLGYLSVGRAIANASSTTGSSTAGSNVLTLSAAITGLRQGDIISVTEASADRGAYSVVSIDSTGLLVTLDRAFTLTSSGALDYNLTEMVVPPASTSVNGIRSIECDTHYIGVGANDDDSTGFPFQLDIEYR